MLNGEYKAVDNTTEKEMDDDDSERSKTKEKKLSVQQYLYKWARSGDTKNLKEFVRQHRQAKDLDLSEFLSRPDDENQDEADEQIQNESKGCCGGGDDDDNRLVIFKPYRSSNTALHYAALHGNADFCKDLNEFGARFQDQKNKLNSTPLHLAAGSADYNTLKYILEKYVCNGDSTLTEQNKIGNTPFHCAVYSQNIECLQLLIQKCDKEGLDPKEQLMQTNHVGVQALRYAVNSEMKQYINKVFNPHLSAGGDNEHKDNNDNDYQDITQTIENNTDENNQIQEED